MMNAIEPLSSELSVVSACNAAIALLPNITINSLSTLSYGQIEKALKSAMYIDEYVHLMGNGTLQQHCTHPINKRIFANDDVFNGNALIYVLNMILRTKNATDHIYALESILKAIKSPEEVDKIWNAVVVPVCGSGKLRKRQEQMQIVVQRLFQLPAHHIDGAVHRLLEHLHFSLLGLVFCEPEESLYIDKFIVLAHQICMRLADGMVPEYFIDSMLDTVQYVDDGLSFYWNCLRNESFAQALASYCIKRMQERAQTDTDTAECEQHAIVVLVSAALRTESPCQKMLFDKLYNAQLSTYWLKLFHNAVFIFD